MIQTYAHQKKLHEARIDIKTLERLFANVITEGTNCSPFESDIIVEKAKEVFAIGDHSESGILQPGHMIWNAIDINEPPGKPLKGSQFRRITLSQKNMMEFALGNVKFLTLVDPNIIWVRETIDALRTKIASMASTCPFDPSICGATSLRMHQFSRARQRSRNGRIAGEKETFSRRLYVHVQCH